MRKVIFLGIGLLETAIATVLVCFGCQLPSTPEVEQNFDRVEKVTAHTGSQVRMLREQVHDLRRPEVQQHTLKDQKVDFDQVQVVSNALGDVAQGLDGFSETLDADAVAKVGQGLNTTADFLDNQVAPGADKAADELDKATAALDADAKRLAELLRTAPPDLKAAKEIHDGLARFSDGLEQMGKRLQPQRLEKMREGFRGLETSLTTGAEQVERLSGFSYPSVTISGFKPRVEQHRFWPEGDKIAEGMRKAAEGVKAAGQELDDLSGDLPKLQASIDEGRKIADKTREALAAALKDQDKLEALLRDVPEHSAQLAEQLPKMTAELSKLLRETKHLKEVAALLRQAQKGIDMAATHWPELRKTLAQSATLLRETQRQLQQTLDHRKEYEAALKQTIVLTEAFATLLPLFTQQLDTQLREQEKGLDNLSKSIDEVGESLPPTMQSTVQLMQTARLLVWLVAGIVGLHGIYLALSAKLGRAYSL